MKLSELRQFNLGSLTTLKGILALMKDPEQTQSVYDVEDGLIGTKAMALAVQHMLAQPGVAELVQERYVALPPDIAALSQYPEGSLGRAYADYITVSGFDPGFYRQIEVTDDTSYLLLRLRQTHDIWHIVADFSVDVAGEVGLKAFELAQTRRTLAGMIVTGGVIRCLLQTPEYLDRVLDRIAVGYRVGSKAKPFLAQKWETQWEKPLTEWRSELNVQPMPVYVP
jgi:ubiquinone biosynthesis protein Coq4